MQSNLIHIKGKLYSLDELWIMAILNLSQNSFYEHFDSKSTKQLLKHVEGLMNNGIAILDIGAVSTRPNSESIPDQDEKKMFSNIISTIKKTFPELLLSVDTSSELTIEHVMNEGADIINDVSGMQLGDEILNKIGSNKLAYILTYNKGGKFNTIKTENSDDILSDALLFISNKLNKLSAHHINDVIVDPGFGFNKSLADNYNLLKQSSIFTILNKPILYGLSRKSMIYNLLETTAEGALNGTTVLNTFAVLNGAQILRVHDTKEAIELKKIASMLT